LKRLSRNATILLASLSLIGGLTYGVWMAVSILAGSLAALLNLRVLDRLGRRLLAPGGKPSALRFLALNGVRIVLMLGGLFAMMQIPFLSVPGAVLGLSVPILSGMLEALYKS
jgi:hypothetical protein